MSQMKGKIEILLQICKKRIRFQENDRGHAA